MFTPSGNVPPRQLLYEQPRRILHYMGIFIASNPQQSLRPCTYRAITSAVLPHCCG